MFARLAAARRLLVAALGMAVVLGPLSFESPANAEIREGFFGIHVFGIASSRLPRVASGSIRLWDSGTSWREVERSRGNFDWSALDASVAIAESHGLRPLLVLGQTPRFYASRPSAPGAYGPGATSMPSLRSWTRYVGRVAQRYGTDVDYQVWNEPSISSYWTGTQAQMGKLTVAASRVITRDLGSGATVVGPSFPVRLGYQQKWFQEFWHQSPGGRNLTKYVDAIAANLYPLEDGAPEAQVSLARFVRHALPAAGRGKPLWNTEINFGLRGGPAANRISRATQASYASRSLVINANIGIRRAYWYAWDVGRIANTHLMKPAGGLTRAGRAWNVTHDWLIGTRPQGCRVTTSGRLAGVWTCTLRVSSDEVRRIYYKPSGEAARITTVSSTRSWSDLAGNVTTRSGRFHLWVGQLPVMVSSRR